MNETRGAYPHHVISRAAHVVRLLPRLLAALGIAAVVLGAAWYAHARLMAPPRRSVAPVASPVAAVTVSVQPARVETLSRAIQATGSIVATDPLSIGAEVTGLRIVSTPVDQGAVVRKGQVLATLDSSVLQAQLEAARGRYAESRAALTRAAQPNHPQDIAAQQAAVTQAQAMAESERANLRQAEATLTNDETNAARYRSLVSQGYATVQETQNVETTAERSRAAVTAQQRRVAASDQAVAAAAARLRSLQAGGSPAEVEIAQAQSRQAAANIQQLQAQLAQTVILAPDDGLILKRDAHIGDITSPGKVLFTMVRQGQLELDAQLPETDLVQVRPGAAVRITTQAGTVQGKVFQISPAVDPQSRLGTVRIRVPATRGIRTGMFARAVIQVGTRKALVVPSAAVQGMEDQRFLYVLSDGRAKRRDVRVGQVSGRRTQISSGIRAGDKVIVAGAGFLNDGDPVDVR